MEIQKQNPEYKFICENCNYKTNRSFDYNTHLSSIRHKNKQSQTDLFICEHCEKEFKTQSGLWKHCNKCQNKNNGKKIDYTIDPIIIEKIMIEIQNKNVIVKENTNEKRESNLSLLNQKCKNPRDIKKAFHDIRIDIKTYMDDFYSIEYDKIIEKLFKNTFMNIPLLERSIYCFEDENPDMHVCYFYYNNEWVRETELQWMNQMAYETNDDYPEEKQTVLLNMMQVFTDNIMNDIKKYKNIDLERKTRAENEFIPIRMNIIQQLMNTVKVNYKDFI
jgi:hypothetical protein